MKITFDKMFQLQEELKKYYGAEKILFEVVDSKDGFIVYRKYKDGRWGKPTSYRQTNDGRNLGGYVEE